MSVYCLCQFNALVILLCLCLSLCCVCVTLLFLCCFLYCIYHFILFMSLHSACDLTGFFFTFFITIFMSLYGVYVPILYLPLYCIYVTLLYLYEFWYEVPDRNRMCCVAGHVTVPQSNQFFNWKEKKDTMRRLVPRIRDIIWINSGWTKKNNIVLTVFF